MWFWSLILKWSVSYRFILCIPVKNTEYLGKIGSLFFYLWSWTDCHHLYYFPKTVHRVVPVLLSPIWIYPGCDLEHTYLQGSLSGMWLRIFWASFYISEVLVSNKNIRTGPTWRNKDFCKLCPSTIVSGTQVKEGVINSCTLVYVFQASLWFWATSKNNDKIH